MRFTEWLQEKYTPRTVIGHELKVELAEVEAEFETWQELYEYLKYTRKAPLRWINGARTAWAAYKYYANGRQKWHKQ